MLKLISNLLKLNIALGSKIQSIRDFDEALDLHTNGKFKEAFPLMQKSAELGNPQAMSLLGSMYLFGQGVKADGGQAEQWLEKSIALGFEESISVLGMAYATGIAGVRVDMTKAQEMLEFAANNGDEQSARMLGMIERGEGMFRKKKRKQTKIE